MKYVVPMLCCFFLLLLCVKPANGQSVTFKSSVENNFPRSLIFSLDVTAPIEIEEITLRYMISGLGRARGSPKNFTHSSTVSTEVEVVTRGSDISVPVGTTFTYFWEVILVDGEEFSSEEVSFVFLPSGNDWVAVENSIAAVYFYGNRLKLAQNLLDAATQTYEVIGRQLLKTDLDSGPVGVVLFSAESEMLEALPGRNTAFDAQTYTCGVKVAANTIYVTDGACDPIETLRHEYVHILTDAAGIGAFGRLPSWLDEGTAVYGQRDPGSGYVSAFNIAVSFDRLIPFSEMATASAEAIQVNLFYGQAYAMVGFLIEFGGPDKFSQFFATIKDGKRYDDALELTYGFNLVDFESAFRSSFDLSELEVESPEINVSEPAEAVGPSSQLSDSEDINTSTISVTSKGFIFGGVGLGLVAISIFVFSTVFKRRLAL